MQTINSLNKEQSKLTIGIGLIFNNLGQVLIDQRKNNKNMGGKWEFPGGKQEEGEEIEYTIIREIYEELGIKVEVKEKLIEFDHSYTYNKIHFVVCFCKLIQGEPKPLESLKLKWVYPNDLYNYSFPAANTLMIATLKNHLLLHKST